MEERQQKEQEELRLRLLEEERIKKELEEEERMIRKREEEEERQRLAEEEMRRKREEERERKIKEREEEDKRKEDEERIRKEKEKERIKLEEEEKIRKWKLEAKLRKEKDSNINESTYADSLASAAGLYIELEEHTNKLNKDLEKYKQSIREQNAKKEEVAKILKEYKLELLNSAVTKNSNQKISEHKKAQWLREEEALEREIQEKRILSFTKTLELNRLKKEFKKMEDYFEGLHIIDFEQLKIENNTLTEKIEDRNEEIHKLKNKIN